MGENGAAAIRDEVTDLALQVVRLETQQEQCAAEHAETKVRLNNHSERIGTLERSEAHRAGTYVAMATVGGVLATLLPYVAKLLGLE